MLKNRNLFYFCHLKKLVRPETFGHYYVCIHTYIHIYLYIHAYVYNAHTCTHAHTHLAA